MNSLPHVTHQFRIAGFEHHQIDINRSSLACRLREAAGVNTVRRTRSTAAGTSVEPLAITIQPRIPGLCREWRLSMARIQGVSAHQAGIYVKVAYYFTRRGLRRLTGRAPERMLEPLEMYAHSPG